MLVTAKLSLTIQNVHVTERKPGSVYYGLKAQNGGSDLPAIGT
jgi:hypothetical protein